MKSTVRKGCADELRCQRQLGSDSGKFPEALGDHFAEPSTRWGAIRLGKTHKSNLRGVYIRPILASCWHPRTLTSRCSFHLRCPQPRVLGRIETALHPFRGLEPGSDSEMMVSWMSWSRRTAKTGQVDRPIDRQRMHEPARGTAPVSRASLSVAKQCGRSR